MKYILLIKDNIAAAKTVVSKVENIIMGAYDRYEEVSEQVFKSVKLPSEKKNGVWVETSKMPLIEYPSIESEENKPTAQDDTDAMLIDHEYRLTMLELGVNE